MIRLLRYLAGYVDFEFSWGFCEGFINGCYKNKINIHNIKKKDGGIYAQCTARQYKKLHKIAFENAGRVKILSKHGIIFELLKYKNRWGLITGAVAFIFIINFLGGFVWNVEISGNSDIQDSEIMYILDKAGVKIGAKWSDTDLTAAENLILACADECSWVSINKIGTTASVEISESVQKPQKKSSEKISNLVAKKDGVIVKETVYSGWQAAKKGDAVSEGDLLISGVYTNKETKVNLFSRSSGEFTARVREPINITVSRQQSRKIYNNSKKYKYLTFFSVKVPLYFGSYKKPSSEIYANGKYLKLSGKTLPVGIISLTVRQYTLTSVNLSDRALSKLAQSRLETKLNGEFSEYEIISKKTRLIINSSDAQISGYAICLENIGKEVQIVKHRGYEPHTP